MEREVLYFKEKGSQYPSYERDVLSLMGKGLYCDGKRDVLSVMGKGLYCLRLGKGCIVCDGERAVLSVIWKWLYVRSQ